MAILTVTVVVPASGDGPIASVANIVGAKTVQLSGLFQGYYDLLASDDDLNFVAVASFDAFGPEGIKQTIPGAFKSVRLRANAQPVGPVTCEVSGVSGVGQNGFGTIASLGAGFSGLTPIVDTSGFIPPTGSEADTAFVCRGSFRGPIVVLGSLDGVDFNPVGEFRVDRVPEGAPDVIELSPLVTDAKVRYVRLSIPGATLGATVVTMGGRVPPAAVAPGTNVSIVATSGSGNYFVQGTLAPGALTDAVGNSVSAPGQNATVVGSSNTVTNTGANVSVFGNGNSAAGQALIVAGSLNTVATNAASLVVVGRSNDVAANALGVVVIGDSHSVSADSHDTIAIGRGNTQLKLGANPCERNILVGVGNTNRANSDIIAIGSNLQTNGITSAINILIGKGIVLGTTNGANASGCIEIGQNLLINDSTINTILLGNSSSVASGVLGCVVIGNSVTNQGDHSVGIGTAISIGHNHQTVAIGDILTLNGDGTLANVLVGRNLTQGSSSSSCVQVGDILSVGNGTDFAIAMGRQSSVGASCESSTAIGLSCHVLDNSPNCYALGRLIQVGSGSNHVVCIGDSNVLTGAAANVVAIGDSVETTNGQTAQLVGNRIQLDGTTNGIVAIGNNINQDATATWGNALTLLNTCVVIGYGLNINPLANLSSAVLIGQPTVAATTYGSVIAIGRGAVTQDISIVIGSLSLSGASSIGIGWGIGSVAGDDNIVIGFAAATATTSNKNVVIGNGQASAALNSVAVGYGAVAQSNCVAVGYTATIGATTFNSVNVGGVIGTNVNRSITISGTISNSTTYSVAVGNGATVDASLTGAVVVGANSSVTGNDGIAIGLGATAGANACVIGESTAAPIHTFTVQGNNGGALSTISVTDN
ncbi:MAG TPA: hypothetical protein VLD86_18785, partial [Ilumatobacteraceae bacterium]|nr:hypothetical protein [Ilumatobacteraceae bacterium]